jgi:hypothetical protein
VAWSYLANRDYKLCYESLYEIGYEGSLENTFDVTSPKLSLNDMLKIQDRSVIYVGILEVKRVVISPSSFRTLLLNRTWRGAT